MRDVEITLIDPIEGTGNYVRASVNDGWTNDSFLINGDDVKRARNEGMQSLITLIMENASLRTHDILSLSRENDADVFFEGKLLGRSPEGLVVLEQTAAPSR